MWHIFSQESADKILNYHELRTTLPRAVWSPSCYKVFNEIQLLDNLQKEPPDT